MARLIDADALIEDIDKEIDIEKNVFLSSVHCAGMRNVIRLVKRMPTIDAVKHGHWTNAHWRNSTHCMDCSVCGGEAQHREFRGVKKYYSICPHCGAKMDGAGEEDETV